MRFWKKGMAKQMMIDLTRAVELLLARDDYHILIHGYPDGDTIGSGYALCRALRTIGKRAEVVCAHEIPGVYSYITDCPEQEFEPKTIVAVDVADLQLLGCDPEKYAGKILLAIDHHATNRDFAEYTWLDAEAAATCEMIYSLILGLGVKPDRKMAEALYTGVSTDTGCFRFSNTTPQTHRIAARLMEAGIDSAEINQKMFGTKSRRRIEIEKHILSNLEFHFGGRVAMIFVTTEMVRELHATEGDLEGITSIPREVEGVLIGLTFRQKEDGSFKVSMRSQPPVNAGRLCELLGGGGHPCAAGCSVQGDLAVVKRQLLELCAKGLEESYHAGDCTD